MPQEEDAAYEKWRESKLPQDIADKALIRDLLWIDSERFKKLEIGQIAFHEKQIEFMDEQRAFLAKQSQAIDDQGKLGSTMRTATIFIAVATVLYAIVSIAQLFAPPCKPSEKKETDTRATPPPAQMYLRPTPKTYSVDTISKGK